MADQIELDSKNFFEKVQKMADRWDQCTQQVDALLVVMGKISQEKSRVKTADFFMWLLNWEFSDTIVLITKQKIIFAVSAKKKAIIDKMQEPQNYQGPKLETILRDIKQDNKSEVVDSLFKNIKSDSQQSPKVGIFKEDKIDGDLTQFLFDQMKQRNFQISDMQNFMDQVHLSKLPSEINSMRTAASFVNWSFNNLINEIEEIIDDDKQVKHSHIQKKIEDMLEQDEEFNKFLKNHSDAQQQFFEYILPVLIQSGENFDLNKFDLESDSQKLNSDNVYINIGGKYMDMTAMASRTLLLNPDDKQKQAYQIAFEAQQALINSLKVGNKVSDAFQNALQVVKQKDASLVSKMHPTFGFGIGATIQENRLNITEKNNQLIEQGMTFHVRITLHSVSSRLKKSVIALGDTVIVTNEGNQILTEKIPKKFHEISYTLDDDEEDGESEVTEEETKVDDGKDKALRVDERIMQNGNNIVQTSRLRQKNTNDNQQNEIRKKSQQELISKKNQELLIRHQRNEISTKTAKQEVKKMDLIQSYKEKKQFPKDIVPGQIYVDMNNDSILVPTSPTFYVPFHISTIKNVSTMAEGQWTFLRINFYVQGSSNMQFPESDKPNHLFVKEITLKNQLRGGQQNHLIQAFKQIKDLIKKVKNKDQEDEQKQKEQNIAVMDDLILNKGRREVLENLVIRPNIIGKKTVGNLEIHQNGVRFSSSKGQKIDITFSNIKHAFFQKCGSDELIVIIHFTLKQPILVGNKKAVDLQFIKETGVAADDIDMKISRKRLNDMDELEQEEMERKQRKKLNQRFNYFVTLIEEQTKQTKYPLEFQMPAEELSFFGCPIKSVVKVKPTLSCLIAISEFPFFVIDVSEIEVIHFERVQFGIKNFDMVIIFKDFLTFKRINSIPIESIEGIKTYFDDIGIIYSESIVPMNWVNVLQQIREDFDGFLQDGGWNFLQDQEDEEGEDEGSEEDEDPNFKDDDYGEESESESGFSESGDDYSESSDMAGEDDLSEEGLDWDELDQKVEEDERKQASRRQTGKTQQTKQPPRKRAR